MTKGLKRSPWTRRHALKLFEKVGVERPEEAYRQLRRRWADSAKLPAELKVHLVIGGAVCEWLGYLAQLQLVRCIERQKRYEENCAVEKASSSILSVLATDMGAILSLCRAGYDVQARSLLRNFIEKMDLLICARLDSDFASRYVGAGSFEDSRRFFYKNISGGKLAKKAQITFRENFPNADFVYDWLMAEWRSETSLMLASAAHPNHTVSMIALFPNLSRGRSKAIGLSGHPTNGSNVTIVKLIMTCMPLHFLLDVFPYDEVQEFFQDAGIDTSDMANFRPYYSLLLNFPLVDTWLQDLDAAVRLSSGRSK